jgi:hypothetical protein
VRQDGVASPRSLSQVPHEAMKPRSTMEGDVNRGTTTTARGRTHGEPFSEGA